MTPGKERVGFVNMPLNISVPEVMLSTVSRPDLSRWLDADTGTWRVSYEDAGAKDV